MLERRTESIRQRELRRVYTAYNTQTEPKESLVPIKRLVGAVARRFCMSVVYLCSRLAPKRPGELSHYVGRSCAAHLPAPQVWHKVFPSGIE